jgi:hypothetical protein
LAAGGNPETLKNAINNRLVGGEVMTMGKDNKSETSLNAIAGIIVGSLQFLLFIGWLGTYILLLVRVISSDASTGVKIFGILILAPFQATFWPVLWVYWLLKCAFGYCDSTPLGW